MSKDEKPTQASAADETQTSEQGTPLEDTKPIAARELGEAHGAQETAAAEEEDLEAQMAYENLKRKREEKRRKRIIIIAVVAAVAVIAAIVLVMGKANSADDETMADDLITTMVYRGDFATTVSANGATEPLNSTVVTPEVDGIIEGVRVQEGSYVNEGDVLFTLKNEDLDQAVRDAEAVVQSAQRTVDSTNAAVDDAYNAYNNAVDQGNSTGDWTGFDEAALKASIRAAEDAYRDAVSALDSARTKLSEAQARADKRTVRAPVSGTIVTMNAKDGAAYGSVVGGSSAASGSSDVLIQISDLSKMKVTVQVNEVDISNIAAGQKAQATFSALPGVELAATVERIASVSTGGADMSGGVVTYAVDLIIPEPDAKLKPGMTATVSITTQSAPDSLIVPTAALSEQVAEDGTTSAYVTVVTDAEAGEMHEVPVEVIAQNSSEAAVKGKLSEGDEVLLMGGIGAGGEDDFADGAYDMGAEAV